MEVFSAKWMTEMRMDEFNNFIHQYNANSPDNGGLMTEEIATALGETNNKNSNLPNCLYPNLHPSYPPFTSQNSITSTTTTTTTTCSDSSSERSWTGHERPVKLLKASTCGSSSSSHLVSFGTSASMASNPQQQVYGNCATPKKEAAPQEYNMNFGSLSSPGVYPNNQNSGPKCGLGIKRAYPVSRTPSSAQDHILAERRRREKLSQRFIALSAIVPGLKKMDKASVLGDAIKYLKQLQERVKSLEEQSKKKTVESVVFVKKYQISTDDDSSSCDESSDGHPADQALPEIEARVADKDVLIRIHCENQKAIAARIFGEVEKLHLSVVQSNVVRFGSATLDITIVAQMDDGFSLTVKEIVKNLRSSLLKSRFK
ncbi:transcription factor bHLH18 [Rhodamnia argentea]|uniref:Transcription factor bHLH18 n=1 Tax=Rhodamnia argentea TaxID=178133 RepID=A0A8B8P3A0_9MYRT|nr:transcription factor bHLH18 [Rhodamnia argentea]